MFALTGAHRSGKTTLAKAAAEKLDIPFVDMAVSQVFADNGLNPKASYPFDVRLNIQGLILDHMDVKLQLASTSSPMGLFIADRSPFDVLGYTMADIQRDTMNHDLRLEAARQIAQARRTVESTLAGIILTPTLAAPPEAETSAQACPFYMDHVAICIQSAMVSYATPNLMAMTIESSGLEERIAEVVEVLQPIVDRVLGTKEVKLWTPGQK